MPYKECLSGTAWSRPVLPVHFSQVREARIDELGAAGFENLPEPEVGVAAGHAVGFEPEDQCFEGRAEGVLGGAALGGDHPVSGVLDARPGEAGGTQGERTLK